jgi:hypothetical protein
VVVVVVAMPVLDNDNLLVMMMPPIVVMAAVCPNDLSILRASRHGRHHEPYRCETGNS